MTTELRKLLQRASTGAVALALLALPPTALAQDAPAAPTELEKLKAENDLAAEQNRRITLKNERDAARSARITGLGLPKFEGTAKLQGNAGQMEATLLASAALAKAAHMSAIVVKPGDLVLTIDEAAPAAEIDRLRGDLKRLTAGLQHVADMGQCAAAPKPAKSADKFFMGAASISSAISLATTLAGMFRSEVTYTALETPGTDATMLADLLAISKKARRIDTPLPPAKSKESVALEKSHQDMEIVRLEVSDLHRRIDAEEAKDRSARQKACHSAAAAALAAADRFDTQWLVANDDGQTRLGQATHLLALLSDTQHIVQVDVQAGGTAMNTKNIATFFGADPLKISGDTIVTWRRFSVIGGTTVNPVPTGGMIACASRRLRMSDIHAFVRSDTRTGRREPDILCRSITEASVG